MKCINILLILSDVAHQIVFCIFLQGELKENNLKMRKKKLIVWTEKQWFLQWQHQQQQQNNDDLLHWGGAIKSLFSCWIIRCNVLKLSNDDVNNCCCLCWWLELGFFFLSYWVLILSDGVLIWMLLTTRMLLPLHKRNLSYKVETSVKRDTMLKQ